MFELLKKKKNITVGEASKEIGIRESNAHRQLKKLAKLKLIKSRPSKINPQQRIYWIDGKEKELKTNGGR